MSFSLEIIFLIAVAFAVGMALGLLLRRRSRGRRASPLASTVLLPIEETESPPSAMSAPVVPAPESEPETPEAPAEPPPAPTALRPRQAPEVATHPGLRPPDLKAPQGEADDLKRLKGIGPQNERRLNGLGIFHFAQIAAWNHEEALWIGAALGFPGRVEREDWIGQARALTGIDGTAAPSSDAAPNEASSHDDVPLFPELSAPPAPPRPRRKR
ncbi:hypothetical protein ABLE91_25240 [Aquabacter sp. CN5-332]|uniref:hypothetical protein n=1 Tax=Aquabacter sp. CN5-332 TaxID=3156608 RepID=UPI0032B58518